jgi:hypothetical protein
MNDPPMRNSLVAAAAEYAKANPTPAASPSPSPSPSPAATPQPSPSPAPPAACLKDENSPECRVQKNLREIEKLGLPIGWGCRDSRALPECVRFSLDPREWALFKGHGWEWLLKFFGWVLTAAAVSLGAPFWFDLLNKFMVVRSTVKPHEKSPEEKSED